MIVTLQFFDGCPNWQTARDQLRAAARETGLKVDLRFEQVDTLVDAARLGFTGSPTILIDGRDPYAAADAPPALACRLYPTPAGLRGSPTVEQLAILLVRHTTGSSVDDGMRVSTRCGPSVTGGLS